MLALVAVTGCASQDLQEPDRETIETRAAAALATIEAHNPGFMDRLQAAPGYAVLGMVATKIPGIGTGIGYGLVVENQAQAHSYLKVTQLEVGPGLGAQRSKIIVVFEDETLLRRMIKGGVRFESSADVGAVAGVSETGKTIVQREKPGYAVYQLTESGAIAAVTLRVLRGQPYTPD